jgi:hypothetical protein
MRKEFIATIYRFRPAQKGITKKYVLETLCPWASKVIKVDGGFMAFENVEDYKTWKNQK